MSERRDDGIRLQKVIAQAGIASRRGAEELIEERRVEVNGHVVTEQGRRVDPFTDHIRVDGKRIPPPRRHAYLVLNKPRGVVCTMDDPEGRPCIADLLGRHAKAGVYHVGRLDTETEGLLLLTNDGDFAQRMAHPRHEIDKTYVADVSGVMDDRTVRRLSRGITLEDGPVRPDRIKIEQRAANRTLVTVVIHEGRNRLVRRMFEAVGHPVRHLSRTRIGPVRLGQLKPGEIRELTRDELGALLDAVQL